MMMACPIIAAPGHGSDSVKYDLRIPKQPLSNALQEFAKQSGIQIIFFSQVTDGFEAPSIVGKYTAADALRQMLDHTGLSFREINPKTIEVQAKDAIDDRKSSAAPFSKSEKNWVINQSDEDATEGSNAAIPSSGVSADVPEAAGTTLDEIVVTAQKRSERLQDVPIPVTAIRGAALVDSNQLRLQDYFSRVPGLSVTPQDSNGAPMVTIRGVTTGALGNPTVGIVLDDVSLGSSGSLGLQVPDLDPSDLAQVEVLRGPQGTLYGASSIGGLIKYVTIDPTTDKFSGRIQAGLSSIYSGNGAGYNVRASANVPLSDNFAVRASAFARRDPGYIDDPARGAKGVNRLDVNGGRLSGLWAISDFASLKLNAVLQHETLHGSSNVHLKPGLGDLQQSALAGTGYFDQRVQIYTAILKAKLGAFDVTSVSGYNINQYEDVIDYTPLYGTLTQSQFGVTGSPLYEHINTYKFTEELRAGVQLGPKADWLIGAFYNHENSPNTQSQLATDVTTGAVAGTFLFDTAPQEFKEYAVFTDLTYHFTDRFDIQFGGRESQNRQNSYVAYIGPYAALFLGGSPTIYPSVHTKDGSFTYLVTPRFKISPDLMVYARLASGYRPGGPNVNAPAFGLPTSYHADKTKNYELGVKGDALNNTVSYDASLYYIDWNNIQLILYDAQSGAGYYTNAGGAKSQGAEFSVEARPLRGFTLSAWVAYTDAQLTQAFPATSTAFGNSGDRLPFGSRLSGSFALDEQFPVTRSITGFVGGSISYVGDRKGVFTGSSERQSFPSYARTDLHAGLKYESWTFDLFANNLADKRAALNGGIGTLYPIAFNYIQPRTIGLTVADRF
jgi:outer membrane receptor protein involved in Fe transport